MKDLHPSNERYLESRSRSYRILVALESYLGVALIVVLLIAVLLQIIDRLMVSLSFRGTEEFARFTFIWLTFVGAAFVAARRRHIGVRLFGGRTTGRVISIMEAVAYLITVVVGIVLISGGIQLISETSHLAFPATGIPLSLVYASLLFGFCLIVLHASLNVVVALKYPRQFIDGVGTEKMLG